MMFDARYKHRVFFIFEHIDNKIERNVKTRRVVFHSITKPDQLRARGEIKRKVNQIQDFNRKFKSEVKLSYF